MKFKENHVTSFCFPVGTGGTVYCNTALQGARTVGLLEDIKSSIELAEEVLLWPH